MDVLFRTPKLPSLRSSKKQAQDPAEEGLMAVTTSSMDASSSLDASSSMDDSAMVTDISGRSLFRRVSCR